MDSCDPPVVPTGLDHSYHFQVKIDNLMYFLIHFIFVNGVINATFDPLNINPYNIIYRFIIKYEPKNNKINSN